MSSAMQWESFKDRQRDVLQMSDGQILSCVTLAKFGSLNSICKPTAVYPLSVKASAQPSDQEKLEQCLPRFQLLCRPLQCGVINYTSVGRVLMHVCWCPLPASYRTVKSFRRNPTFLL